MKWSYGSTGHPLVKLSTQADQSVETVSNTGQTDSDNRMSDIELQLDRPNIKADQLDRLNSNTVQCYWLIWLVFYIETLSVFVV